MPPTTTIKELAEEARALEVEPHHKPNGAAIKSEDGAVVSGSIEGSTGHVAPPLAATTSVDELITLLDDKQLRVQAAAELCDRAEGRAAAAVIASVRKMSRAEAVRILGKSVKFGPAAAAPLITGLASNKAYLRHGSALALALLRTEDGTIAVIDLLLQEPTEVWREVARAIGQVGPQRADAARGKQLWSGTWATALTPAVTSERVAWAMAHVGVRGGQRRSSTTMAGEGPERRSRRSPIKPWGCSRPRRAMKSACDLANRAGM